MGNDDLQMEKVKKPSDGLREEGANVRLVDDTQLEHLKETVKKAEEVERIAIHRRMEIERQVRAGNEYRL